MVVFSLSIFLSPVFPVSFSLKISALKSCFLTFIVFLTFFLELSQCMQFVSWICFLWLALCAVFDFSMLFLPSSPAISYLFLLLKVGSCVQICMLFPRTQRVGVGESLCWAARSSGWTTWALPFHPDIVFNSLGQGSFPFVRRIQSGSCDYHQGFLLLFFSSDSGFFFFFLFSVFRVIYYILEEEDNYYFSHFAIII